MPIECTNEFKHFKEETFAIEELGVLPENYMKCIGKHGNPFGDDDKCFEKHGDPLGDVGKMRSKAWGSIRICKLMH